MDRSLCMCRVMDLREGSTWVAWGKEEAEKDDDKGVSIPPTVRGPSRMVKEKKGQ